MASPLSIPARNTALLVFCIAVTTLAMISGFRKTSSRALSHHVNASSVPPDLGVNKVASSTPEVAEQSIDFPKESWKAASLEIAPAMQMGFAQSVELTGKVTLNEDHVAHIFPLVDGRVDEVKIQFGDRVKKGDVLVVVQSKEVGQSMLQLFQDRLQRDFAITKDRWTQEVSKNTLEMLKLMRDDAPIEAIEAALKNKPLGDYRDRLMTAYISHYRTRKHLERLAPLTNEGVVTGRQLLEAESERDAARATVQSLIEQTQQDIQQASAMSTQSVRELQTRVSVDETTLEILGIEKTALVDVDPTKLGEAISHYPIHSPFDGTIISKDVVLLEHVGTDRQILSIADLSTVWVTTNIYEEHLPLLNRSSHQTIRLRTNVWPDKVFEAKVFYTGDVVDENTRTVSMRALADNADGLLKPGMFVNVELPHPEETDVLQVPLSAIIEHEGKSFVFVHIDSDRFKRCDVQLGRRNSSSVEVKTGIVPGDPVVIRGGFALKSRMLADLLSE